MKKIVTSITCLAIMISCGSDFKGNKHKGKDRRGTVNNKSTYLQTPYDGPDETKIFYNLCVKDEKSKNDEYLIEMVSKSVDEHDLKKVDCNLISKKLSKAEQLMFLYLLDGEILDFSVLADLENIKEYYLLDTNFSKTKNIESLSYVEIFSFGSTGSRTEIDFNVLNNAPALKKVYFSPLVGRNIKNLMPLKNNSQLEVFELWRENSVYVQPDLTKETCPMDAKSKVIVDFCEKYAKL